MNPRDECDMWARAADNYREQSEKFRRERDEARRIARVLLAALQEADRRLILSAEWREEDRDEYNMVRDPVAHLLPSQDSILP